MCLCAFCSKKKLIDLYESLLFAPISLPSAVLACVFQLPFTASCERQSQVRLSGVIIFPSRCRFTPAPLPLILSLPLSLFCLVCESGRLLCVCGWLAVRIVVESYLCCVLSFLSKN